MEEPDSGIAVTGDAPVIVRSTEELHTMTSAWQRGGQSWALVPTMGALHEGHAALIQAARQACDHVVVSIFVNPTQFGPKEDFSAYPRDEKRDVAFLAAEDFAADSRAADSRGLRRNMGRNMRSDMGRNMGRDMALHRAGGARSRVRGGGAPAHVCGAIVAWLPGKEDMYPPDFVTQLRLDSLAHCLCGRDRPHHFPGVATVVARLLQLCRPQEAFFGEKDYQQLVIIRSLVRDLVIDTRIHAVATVRHDDGLARSSRNAYLTADQRQIAPQLYRILTQAVPGIVQGKKVDVVCAAARDDLMRAGFDDVSYVECRDGGNLSPAPPRLEDSQRPWRLFASVRLGRARLIDNVEIVKDRG